MKQDLRQAIFNKYPYHCAYCGCKLTRDEFQVDHIIPQYHHRLGLVEGDVVESYDNLVATCAKCNNFKSAMTLEEFRIEIGKQVHRLGKNPQFDRALRYGLIEIIEKPIVFYFER